MKARTGVGFQESCPAASMLMAAAKAGQGLLSFGQLHALSAAFYLVKVALVLALAWRAGRQS